MKSIYICCIVFAVLGMVPKTAFPQCVSQIIIKNPSFEGSAGTTNVPPSWTACNSWNGNGGAATWPTSTTISTGNTNSIYNPNIIIYNNNLNAFQGNTYLGLGYNSTVGAQGVTQVLPAGDTFFANVNYTTSIELALPQLQTVDEKGYAKYNIPSCAGISLYGGNAECQQSQLLWTSGNLNEQNIGSNWINYPISFTPNADYTVLTLVMFGCDQMYTNEDDASYIFVDTLAPILASFQASAAPLRNNPCSNDSFGQASVTVTGPAATSYVWNTTPRQTTSTLTGVPAGTYTVTVTSGGNLCATASVTITAPPVLNANAAAVSATCFSTGNGQATANASGGTPGYNYSWSNGQTGSPITGLYPGNYVVTVNDANYCSATSAVIIDSNPLMTVNGYATAAACPDFKNGKLTANPVGGNPPVKAYLWNTSPAQDGQTAYNLKPGMYTVTITDAQNCTVAASFPIDSTSPSAAVVVGDAKSCNGHTINGTLKCNASGGTPSYSYTWSNGQNGLEAINLAPGTYSVTITDANSCQYTANGTVALIPGVNVTVGAANTSCGSNTGTVFANVSGGNANTTFHWNTGATTDSLLNVAAGAYHVTATENGCSASASGTVVANGSRDTVTLSTDTVNMCAGDSAYICVNSQNAYTTYRWNNGDTTPCAYTLYAGNVYLTVTDQIGCTVESSHAYVNVYENPYVAISGNDDTLRVYNFTHCQWFLNNTSIQGATSNIYLPTEPGSYTVEVTDDSTGCNETSSAYVYSPTNGIGNVNTDLWVKVFPNPSQNGVWNIMAGTAVIGGTMQIFDDNGRLVYKAEIDNANTLLGLDVAKGIYFMQITTPAKSFNLKLTRL